MAKRDSWWLNEIIVILKELGGHAYYRDVYELFYERNGNKTSDWKAQIRGTVERFSSDSDYYGGNEDIFFAVEGKGKGHWGLREYDNNSVNIDITEDDCGFPEGKKRLRQHIIRERNPKVIKLAKENYQNKNGHLKCEVCEFDFEEKYGEIGKDYIEGHHTIFVKDIPEGYITVPDDIVLLCANCHRMIHRRRPWITKEKLGNLLKRKV
jgi:putative restriction endonuclease